MLTTDGRVLASVTAFERLNATLKAQGNPEVIAWGRTPYKPLPNTFYYFAYGSNMYSNRLRAPNRCPNAQFQRVAYVRKKRRTFSKVSTDSAGNTSGKCHIEETGNEADRVYGALFRIPSNEKAALDRAEGVGQGYEEGTIRTFSDDGHEEDAAVYLATNTDSSLLPYHWYKGFVLRGANEYQLPETSRSEIASQESKDDPDDNRRKEMETLLNLP